VRQSRRKHTSPAPYLRYAWRGFARRQTYSIQRGKGANVKVYPVGASAVTSMSESSRFFICLLSVLAGMSLLSLGAAGPPPQPTSLDDYVGTYELTPTFHLTVTREGRALYLRVTGQTRAQLTPREGHEFVIVGSTLRVIFSVQQDTGDVVDLLFEQGGLGRRAVKLDAPVATSITRARIVLASDLLARYVGTYEEQPGFEMRITQDRDHLIARLTDLPGIAIFAKSKTTFVYEDERGGITFQLDTSDVVTALVLHQGDSDVEMRRVD